MTIYSPLDQPEESPAPSPAPERSTPTPAPNDQTPAPNTAAATSGITSESKASSSIEPEQTLAIEPPTETEPEGEEDAESMDLGQGQVIKLDKLGPMIVNSDGTLSRIQNWQDLHPIEQERTVRLLVKKRNLIRMAKMDSESDKNSEGEKVTALKEAEAAAKGGQ